MHSATLYRHNEEGRKDKSTPIARVTVDDDAKVEVRMLDGTVLVSMSLEHFGYTLLWGMYPVVAPETVPPPRVIPVKRVKP